MYKRDRGSSDRGYGGHQQRSFAPIKVGQELDVNIEAVGEKGDGITKVKGFVIFVPNTKAGENVKIRVTKVSKKVGFAEVIGAGEAKSESEEESMDDTEETSDEDSEESEEDSVNDTEETSDEDSENF